MLAVHDTYQNECFMTNDMPSGMKKHCRSIEPENLQMAKNVPFLLSSSSSSSDGLVQNCATLSQWFSHKTVAFYTEQCTSPLLFATFK